MGDSKGREKLRLAWGTIITFSGSLLSFFWRTARGGGIPTAKSKGNAAGARQRGGLEGLTEIGHQGFVGGNFFGIPKKLGIFVTANTAKTPLAIVKGRGTGRLFLSPPPGGGRGTIFLGEKCAFPWGAVVDTDNSFWVNSGLQGEKDRAT